MSTSTSLPTLASLLESARAAGQPCLYHGAFERWIVAAARNRDSDLLVLSNFRTMHQSLGVASRAVVIERMNHWAVGWVEYLLISPRAKKALAEAERMHKALLSYPVLDDTDYSNVQNEAWIERRDNAMPRDLSVRYGSERGRAKWARFVDAYIARECDDCMVGCGDESQEGRVLEYATREYRKIEDHADARADYRAEWRARAARWGKLVGRLIELPTRIIA